MTYCLGIMTKDGLVMASDSRTNAGYDAVNTSKKMHTFVQAGERVFVLLMSGSLSCTQSILTLLKRDFDKGEGLWVAQSMYDAAREIGKQVRTVGELDRPYLERDDYRFNVHAILGGQVRGEAPGLFMIYPQGNPLQATSESPYLQIGETKYGRPILDRGIRYDRTTLEEAAKYALLSLDSTMRSNVTVGPPIHLVAYANDEFDITRQKCFEQDDPGLTKIRTRWEQALRQAVLKLPDIRFKKREEIPAPQAGGAAPAPQETIEVVEPAPTPTEAGELQPQAFQSPPAPRRAARSDRA
jgi:putative proteasome-type protease